MESDEESENITDWTQLDSMKAFEWAENTSSPMSRLLHQSPACSMNTDLIDSSTKLVDNTPSIRDNFIEHLATKATAPVSLLVESLVQQLCSMIEPDQTRAEQLYSTICNQLHRMNLIDETFKMGEFDVMRSQYQRALYQLATVARGHTDVPLNLQTVWPLSDSSSMQWSRYHREFDELDFIAGGGFGRVYRARNKLDGIEYAVKKVTIKYRTIKRVLTHIAEVKTFASLNHNNIVPYKAAWLEPLLDDPRGSRPRVTDAQHVRQNHLANNRKRNSSKKVSTSTGMVIIEPDSKSDATGYVDVEDSDSDNDSETDSSESEVESRVNSSQHLRLPQNQPADESSEFIQFQQSTFDEGDDDDDEDVNDDNDDVVDGANLSADKRLCKPNENHPNNNFLKSNLEFDDAQPHLKLKWATLYIQMSFRPLTLRAWIDERNKHSDFNAFYHTFIEKSVQQWNRTMIDENDPDCENGAVAKYNERIRRPISVSSLAKNLSKVWDSFDVTLNIFIQALSGLRYIHLQNIVHHDIKPSNIFIGCEKNGDLYVQLGDFGLACPLEAKHSPDSMIGTITYAAPEQLRGHCNPKSDVYSLGIILLELFIPFNTDMERLLTIEAARKGNLPHNKIPTKILKLLEALLEKPNKRPDAIQTFDLLSQLELWNGNSGGIHETPTQHNNDLKNQLNQVTDELKQLKMQLAPPTSQSINSSVEVCENSISNMNFECSDIKVNSTNHQSISFSSNSYHIDEHLSTSVKMAGSSNESEEKDRQIRILTNRLSASDKEANDLRKEIERLRGIIKQKNG